MSNSSDCIENGLVVSHGASDSGMSNSSDCIENFSLAVSHGERPWHVALE